MQPVWTPDNNLLFIGDQTGWWNLYQYSSDGNHQNLLPCEADVGGCQWVFGRPDFTVEPSGGGTVIMKRNEVQDGCSFFNACNECLFHFAGLKHSYEDFFTNYFYR